MMQSSHFTNHSNTIQDKQCDLYVHSLVSKGFLHLIPIISDLERYTLFCIDIFLFDNDSVIVLYHHFS